MSNGIALLNNKLKDQGHQLEVLAQVLLVRCPMYYDQISSVV